MSWLNPPPVMVISGTHEFLRHREVQKATLGAIQNNRQVMAIEAGDSQGLREALSGSFLFTESTLAFVESPPVRKRKGGSEEAPKKRKRSEVGGWSENDVARVVEHGKGSDTDVVLVVVHPGDIGEDSFAAQVIEGLPKRRHITYEAPKPWDEQKEAVGFLHAELTRYGKNIAPELASAYVRQAGSEYGRLSFEALKLSTYLDADGGRIQVEREDAGKVVAQAALEDWGPILEAVGAKNPKAIIRAVADLKAGPAGDSPVGSCTVVARRALKWLHAAAWEESGAAPEEAASKVSIHPYPYKKDVRPVLQRWGRVGLTRLVRRVTAAERAVKRGAQAPWICFESALLLSCQSSR